MSGRACIASIRDSTYVASIVRLVVWSVQALLSGGVSDSGLRDRDRSTASGREVDGAQTVR